MDLNEPTVLIGIAGWRATLDCGLWIVLLANPVYNIRWFEYLCLGTLVPRCVYAATSVDQWDTPRRPLGFCCELL